jgi:uncharacterized Tic20 family protein
MNPIADNAQLTAMLSLFVAQLPILIVSLLGCIVIMGRKNDLGSASGWALMGFGLSVLLCVVIPVAQMLAQNWAMESGRSLAQRASIFTVLAVAWSLLRALSYALLLMAVLAGRQQRSEI